MTAELGTVIGWETKAQPQEDLNLPSGGGVFISWRGMGFFCWRRGAWAIIRGYGLPINRFIDLYNIMTDACNHAYIPERNAGIPQFFSGKLFHSEGAFHPSPKNRWENHFSRHYSDSIIPSRKPLASPSHPTEPSTLGFINCHCGSFRRKPW